uniref:XK-related protein n=1 Tax=Pectinophora gossypiella TaxID=13191 RepID=A0A1E1WMP5_PECGO
MVACELDKEVSGEVLGWRLPAWQALLFHRVLPSCGGLIVYLTVMCYDIALIYEHYNNGHSGVGAFCIVLMSLPAVISLVFTLASPPPNLQTELSAFSINVEKKELKWIAMQFLNCLFFPIAAIGRSVASL